MDTRSYLERIDYRGPVEPTAETLRALQVAHLQAVPFENLSIHSGEPIVLEDEKLFDKIVARRRGGFCYELNGLFAALLRDLGFNVDMLSAGVTDGKGGFGPDFDHMVLLVELDDRWLVDVGFGDSFIEPLLLDKREDQVQGERAYRIVPDGTHLIMMQRVGSEDWRPQYRFSLQTHQYADYAEMCRYHQTSPESHFTKGRICSRATESGRMTLSEMRFITTGPGSARDEQILAGDTEYANALRERFGIVMTSAFSSPNTS